MPAARNGRWSSSIRVESRDEVVVEVLTPRGFPDDVREPRRRVGVAADVEVAIADHVDEERAPCRSPSEPSRLRGVDVVAAARCCRCRPIPGAALPRRRGRAARSSTGSCGAFSTRASSSEKRGARPAVARADEPELACKLRVVVARDHDALLARAGDRRRRGSPCAPCRAASDRPTPARRR